MTHESLLNAGWLSTVDRLGGAEQLETEAREVGAFRRAREVCRRSLTPHSGVLPRLNGTKIDCGLGRDQRSCDTLKCRLAPAAAQHGSVARGAGRSPPYFLQRRSSRRSCERAADPDRRWG